MRNLFLIFLILIALTGFVSACYQENANASTVGDGSCGLVYTGDYSNSTEGWASGGGAVIDKNWDTGDTKACCGGESFWNITYKKPAGFGGAIWKVKDGLNGNVNITIPNLCFNAISDRILLRTSASTSFTHYSWKCFNGTGFTNISMNIGPTGVQTTIFEEAIIWNLNSSIWYNTPSSTVNSFRITEFINKSGTNFTLGGVPYKVMGANAYYLADYATGHTFDDNGNEIFNGKDAVLEILNEAQYLNLNVIRTWAGMQGGGQNGSWIINNSGGHHNLFEVGVPGNYSEEMFVAMDYVIYQASQRDIRLQMVLVNNWNDYGGMRWYAQMSPTTNKTFSAINDTSNYNWSVFKDQFYTDENARTYFRNFINKTLNRNNTFSGIQYKNDPAIFAWMLANEPRAKSDNNGAGKSMLVNWTTNMTAYIKSIDTNHLVGLGIEGFGNQIEGTDMISNHNGTGVDFATFALHPTQWNYLASASENATDLAWVTGGITSNITIDWWTNGSSYSFNNRYAGSYIPNYVPALARHSYQNWVQQNVNWSNQLNLPVIMQEIAMNTSQISSQKNRFFQQAIRNFYDNGGDGMMMWNLNHDGYYYSTTPNGLMDDGYSFYLSDNATLKDKSQSVIDSYNFSRYGNNGSSWVTILNNFKYDFTVNVDTNSTNLIRNCTINFNIYNATTNYNSTLINSSTIIQGQNYVFTKQFEFTDRNLTWFSRCCGSAECLNSNNYLIILGGAIPAITLITANNTQIYNDSSVNNYAFSYNVSHGLDISNCELYVDAVLNATDSVVSKGAIMSISTPISPIVKNHTWYIKCTDIDNNIGTSETRSFSVVQSIPVANFSFLFNITYFNKDEFNDSTSNKTFNYKGSQNQTFWIRANQRDELINTSFDMSGSLYNGTYPKDVKIYINGSLSNDVGDLFAGEASLTTLNDSSTNKTFTIGTPNQFIYYLRIRKAAQVSSATINFDTEYSSGSDGSLIFNSSTKTYGNLVYNEDYYVSGDTLYLKLNKQYNFTDFELGSGMTLTTTETTGAGLCIKARNAKIAGTITLTNIATIGSSSSFNCYGTTLTTSLGSGGSGGSGSLNRIGGSPNRCYGGGGSGGGVYSQDGNPHAYAGYFTTSSSNIQGTGAYSSCTGCGPDYDNGGNAGGAYGSGGATIARGQGTSTATGGNGANSYGGTGGAASGSTTGGACAYSLSGGGGGGGGTCGKVGYDLYIRAYNISISATINSAGTTGGNGGAGGAYAVAGSCSPFSLQGSTGAGGGGGGGGGGGDVYFINSFLSDTSSKTLTGGAAGSGNIAGGSFGGYRLPTGGSNGIAGTAGGTTTNYQRLYSEIGIIDGIYEWDSNWVNSSGQMNTTSSSLVTQIQTYLTNCVADSLGYCNVPVYINSQYTTPVTMTLSNINIQYDYYDTINVILSKNIMSSFLNNSVGNVNIPITIENQQNGTIGVSNLSMKYRGGNSTITCIAHSLDYSVNTTILLNNYYSNYDYQFPNNIEYLEFIPPTSQSKNVTPYGQASLRPIFNVTTWNTGGKNMNFSILMNNSMACVNLTISTTNNKSQGYLLNSTFRDLKTNQVYETNFGLWMWADYNCSYKNWTLFNPNLYFKGCCVGCVCSDEVA